MLAIIARSVPKVCTPSFNASSNSIRLRARPYGSASFLSSYKPVSRFEHNTPELEASNRLTISLNRSFVLPLRFLHTANSPMRSSEQEGSEKEGIKEQGKSSQAQRLKLAVREYGATVVVFHTCISLFTLGVSYAAVSSGLDVMALLSKLGVGQSILESKIATGASTFVIAYAVHKVFAPARMATTLAATPFIVRYLRRVGILKRPPPKA